MSSKLVLGAQKMREIGDNVHRSLPEGYGFVLLTFPFNAIGVANYISDASREDVVAHLRKTADVIESNRMLKTPEEN